jgi:Calcineurin-like phosphoesterase
MTNKIAIISDIHGCYEELTELYDHVLASGISPDSLYSVGDLVDKGGHGDACVTFAREKNIKTVMGNHESKYVRWFKHQVKKRDNPKYVVPMELSDRDLREAYSLKVENIDWISSLPYYFKVGHYLIIHAGMFPSTPIEKHPVDKLTVIRHLDGRNKSFSVNYHEINNPLPSDVVEWFHKYDGDYHVVHGHSIMSLNKPLITKGIGNGYVASIETGCCSGGYLTAAIVDPSCPEFHAEFLQVKAKKLYKPLLVPVIEPLCISLQHSSAVKTF